MQSCSLRGRTRSKPEFPPRKHWVKKQVSPTTRERARHKKHVKDYTERFRKISTSTCHQNHGRARPGDIKLAARKICEIPTWRVRGSVRCFFVRVFVNRSPPPLPGEASSSLERLTTSQNFSPDLPYLCEVFVVSWLASSNTETTSLYSSVALNLSSKFCASMLEICFWACKKINSRPFCGTQRTSE